MTGLARPGSSRVWDLPTRAVHWLLVVALAGAWWTAETGRLELHRACRYVILALVVFRIFWGVSGASTARFRHFVRPPGEVFAYVRAVAKGAPPNGLGHSPLGALSVLALLLALATQVALGLFAVDVDGIESGPLSHLVSFETGRLAAEVHGLVFVVLQVLVALHLAAVGFYLFRRGADLITPMITGRSMSAKDDGFKAGSPAAAVIGALLAGALAWLVSTGLHF